MAQVGADEKMATWWFGLLSGWGGKTGGYGIAYNGIYDQKSTCCCPSAPYPLGSNANKNFEYTHYVFNVHLTGTYSANEDTYWQYRARQLSCLVRPSDTEVTADSNFYNSGICLWSSWFAYRHCGGMDLREPTPNNSTLAASGMGSNKSNFLMMDGHVAPMNYLQFKYRDTAVKPPASRDGSLFVGFDFNKYSML